mmetsp:Transcript_1182/g.1662  ORF Transcript_1182/g.1662 Transcript_1182/m.1662 type:complete len:131 (-) Transcript_1182:35-427(-)
MHSFNFKRRVELLIFIFDLPEIAKTHPLCYTHVASCSQPSQPSWRKIRSKDHGQIQGSPQLLFFIDSETILYSRDVMESSLEARCANCTQNVAVTHAKKMPVRHESRNRADVNEFTYGLACARMQQNSSK